MIEGFQDPLSGGHPLPDRYGEDCLFIMARDPYCLYAYWEVSPPTLERLPRAGKEDVHALLQLRVFKHRYMREAEVESCFDIHLAPGASSWYIAVGDPDCAYHAELGRVLPDGRFMTLLTSNTVQTPRDSVSEIIDENWHLPDWKARKLYRRIALYHLSSPELFRWRSLRVHR